MLEISIHIEQCYITLFDKKVQYSGKRCIKTEEKTMEQVLYQPQTTETFR